MRVKRAELILGPSKMFWGLYIKENWQYLALLLSSSIGLLAYSTLMQHGTLRPL